MKLYCDSVMNSHRYLNGSKPQSWRMRRSAGDECLQQPFAARSQLRRKQERGPAPDGLARVSLHGPDDGDKLLGRQQGDARGLGMRLAKAPEVAQQPHNGQSNGAKELEQSRRGPLQALRP